MTELFASAAGCLDTGGVFAFSYETGDCNSYELQPSGRAHAAAYVDSLHGRDFVLIASVATTLRLEANQPVGGRMVLLRRV